MIFLFRVDLFNNIATPLIWPNFGGLLAAGSTGFKSNKILNINTHSLLVPGPVIGGKCTSQRTHSKSHDKIHDPEPAKQVVDLHAEQMTVTDR